MHDMFKENLKIQKKLKIHSSLHELTEVNGQIIVIEDLEFNKKHTQDDYIISFSKAIAYIPRFNEKKKLIREVLGEIKYLPDETDQIMKVSIGSKKQPLEISAELLKYAENLAYASGMKQVHMICPERENAKETFERLGYREPVSKYSQNLETLYLFKTKPELHKMSGSYESLYVQAHTNNHETNQKSTESPAEK